MVVRPWVNKGDSVLGLVNILEDNSIGRMSLVGSSGVSQKVPMTKSATVIQELNLLSSRVHQPITHRLLMRVLSR